MYFEFSITYMEHLGHVWLTKVVMSTRGGLNRIEKSPTTNRKYDSATQTLVSVKGPQYPYPN